MDRRKTDGGRTDTDGRGADVSLAEVAVPDDASVLDLDERPELVRLAEPVRSAQLLEVIQVVGRWRSQWVTPISNGTFEMPAIASEGIQEIAVTKDSIRVRVKGRSPHWRLGPACVFGIPGHR